MADTQQDPGWWMASDGRWYPPHTHPYAQAEYARQRQQQQLMRSQMRSHRIGQGMAVGYMVGVLISFVLVVGFFVWAATTAD